jgi:hypothetical protein
VGAVRWMQDLQKAAALPRRATDRVEDLAAWVVAVLALVLLLASGLVGVGVARSTAHEAASREHVDAVLLTDAPPALRDPDARVARAARYRDPAGAEHVVVVPVAGRPPAGRVVHLWVDGGGRVTTPPPGRADATLRGVVVAAGVALAGGLLLLGLWTGVRRRLDARNAQWWAREWARVEPAWSGR